MMVTYSRVTRRSESSEFGYTLRTEPAGFADRLDVGVRNREESRMTKGFSPSTCQVELLLMGGGKVTCSDWTC